MRRIFHELMPDDRLEKFIQILDDQLARSQNDDRNLARFTLSVDVQRYKRRFDTNTWNIISNNLLRYVRELADSRKIPMTWFNKAARNIGKNILGGGYTPDIEQWLDLLYKIVGKLK